jgi:RNA polymerase sigma-70 factor (ECF subfamily)
VISVAEPINHEPSPLTWDLADADARTPGEEVAGGEVRDHVWSALAELPDKLRPMVILYDLHGLSYREIAELLGCPLGTVKSRLFNARCQLRDKLRERLPEDFLADLTVPMQSSVLGATAV